MKGFLIILCFLFLFPGLGFGQQIYFSETAKTFGWDAPPWSDSFGKNCAGSLVSGRYFQYELQLLGTGGVYTYSTRETRFTARPLRAGLYDVKIRVKLMNPDGTPTTYCSDGTEVVSIWCESNSPCAMLMDGSVGPWKISFGMIPTAVPTGLKVVK